MTKEEIKASIAANIAGQFNQIDISGKLAGILEGIVDAIPEGPKIIDLKIRDMELNTPYSYTKEEFIEQFGQSAYDILLGDNPQIILQDKDEVGSYLYTLPLIGSILEDDRATKKLFFGFEVAQSGQIDDADIVKITISDLGTVDERFVIVFNER